MRSAGSLGTSKKRRAASPSASAKSEGRRTLSLRIIQFFTGASSRHKPTGSISTSRPTDFGAEAANSAASRPPKEWPTTAGADNSNLSNSSP